MDGFLIKICGITSVDDALLAIEAGADAIGLNFYHQSPRYVGPTVARAIARAVGDRVVKVGVFVNTDAPSILSLAEHVRFDLIQLHGDEPPEALGQLAGRPVMKAFRIGADGLAPVAAYLRRCQELKAMPQRVLFDAQVEGMYGGSGQTAPWERVTIYGQAGQRAFFAGGCNWKAVVQYRPDDAAPPLVLAGGLTPENVTLAIRHVRPAAVDTASGVESSPGKKDPAKLQAFAYLARQAFEHLGR